MKSFVTITLMLMTSSTHALTKDEVKRQVPNACYEHWIGDGICDSECGAFDNADCSARFKSGTQVSEKTSGETRGFEILESSQDEQNTRPYYVAYKASRDSERKEQVIRRGQDFSIRAVKGPGNIVQLTDKHYCKFKNRFKGLDCPLEDHQETSVIVHPFGGTVEGETGLLSRSGSWWTVGSKKVQGGEPTFETIPDTCKLKSVDVKMVIDHTYLSDLVAKLVIGDTSHSICDGKCDAVTTVTLDALDVTVPDTMTINIKDTANQDKGELLSLSLSLEMSGTGCPEVQSSEGSITAYEIEGSKKACEPISGKTDEYICKAMPYDIQVGRREITLFRGDSNAVESGTVIVLFNPFKDDSPVYMRDESKREEYAIEQTGRQYYGNIPWRVRADSTNQGVGSMSWAYHQFDPDVVDAVALLVDAAKSQYDLSSPIWVSRHLTNVLSATTDRNVPGVLHGKWPGADEKDPYKDGSSPTEWTGSRKIFSQWLKERETVKYGQCWVFAGILTSALRALGIPSRSLTTFRSAHDTRYESESDDYDHIIHYGTEAESIWNFHVWVDAWFSRPDLNENAGWNAVDATPQESSSFNNEHNEMTMGPAYVPWIKKNNVDHENMYDAPFVLGEVNAVHRFQNGDDRTDVGRKIVTKKVGTNQRGRWGEHVLNDDYKVCPTPFGEVSEDGTCTPGTVPETTFEWPEEDEGGSRFQETSLGLTKNQAKKRVRNRQGDGSTNDNAKVNDGTPRQLMIETGQHRACGRDCFHLNVVGDTKLGEDVVIEFEKTSKAVGEDWQVHIVVEAVSNNAQPLSSKPLMDHKAMGKFTIPVATYLPYMDRTLDLKVYASAVSQSQDQTHFEELHLEMQLPKMKVVADEANSGVELTFKNPLDKELLYVKLLISDPYGDRYEVVGDVAAHTSFSRILSVPKSLLDRCVTVSVICDNLFTLPWTQCSCETTSASV